jgi:hypothetical protein
MAIIAFIALFLLHLVTSTTTATETYDYFGRDLKGNETGSCGPNENLDGISCTNVSLYSTTLGGEPLWVSMNLEQVFDEVSYTFTTRVWLWVTFRQFVDQLWADFTFNSSYANNTWLATGYTAIGSFEVPTSYPDAPNITVWVNATHNVTLYTDDRCVDSPDNDTYCDSGWLLATLGLYGWGTEETETANVSATLDDPWSVQVTAPFTFYVNPTLYCTTLDEYIQYSRNLTIWFERCPKDEQCTSEAHVFNTTSWDEHRSLADNACFEHAIKFD